MTLPNFLIVGAMKSGSTSLRNHLKPHPDVFMHSCELHFFNRNYRRGIQWYERQFEEASNHKAVGEKTPRNTAMSPKYRSGSIDTCPMRS